MNAVQKIAQCGTDARGLNVGNIDEISQALGAIQSSITTLVDGHKDTMDKLSVINDKVSTQTTNQILDKAQIEAAHKRLDLIEPKVDSHDEKFRFIAWLVTGLSVFIGFIVQYLLPFFGHLFR